jgi:hypothetical protein
MPREIDLGVQVGAIIPAALRAIRELRERQTTWAYMGLHASLSTAYIAGSPCCVLSCYCFGTSIPGHVSSHPACHMSAGSYDVLGEHKAKI